MEKVHKSLAVIFLGISILVSSFWVSKSIENGFATIAQGIVVASGNIGAGINNSESDILNQAQAANYLQIPEERLLKVIDSIPHVRINGQNIFSKQALTEWVQKSNFINVN